MKKILIFILLLLSFAGCKKKTVNETVFIVNNNVPSQTTVSEFSFELLYGCLSAKSGYANINLLKNPFSALLSFAKSCNISGCMPPLT